MTRRPSIHRWRSPLRALIVDDEAPARAKVRRLLEAESGIEIVGEAGTGREAVAAIKRSQPDIVFLDIQMPGLDGFEVLDAIDADGAPYVVFVTADEGKAIKAFEVGAVDYLLKPYTPERFAQVLERARMRAAPSSPLSSRAAASPSSRAASEGSAVSEPPYLKRLLVIANGRATFLPVDRIDWIESDRNYVNLHAGAEVHRLRATIANVASRLDPSQFLRINRSMLVRLDAVASMNEWSHGDYKVTMRDGSELTWSRRYRGEAEREFGIIGQ
jgi:two-component system LytT family response regulator